MEANGQLRAHAILHPGEKSPGYPLHKRFGGSLEPVWVLWRKYILALLGIKPRLSSPQPIAIPIELSQLPERAGVMSKRKNCGKGKDWGLLIHWPPQNRNYARTRHHEFGLNCIMAFILNTTVQSTPHFWKALECHSEECSGYQTTQNSSREHSNRFKIFARILITTEQTDISPECGNLGKQGIIHSHVSFNGHWMISLKL
jgi:hypothetical protein